ncbi:hypothetical protein BH10BAC5_BH10BAC5_14910 [soil metagenome]
MVRFQPFSFVNGLFVLLRASLFQVFAEDLFNSLTTDFFDSNLFPNQRGSPK